MTKDAQPVDESGDNEVRWGQPEPELVTLATTRVDWVMAHREGDYPDVVFEGTEMTREQADLALADAQAAQLEIREL